MVLFVFSSISLSHQPFFASMMAAITVVGGGNAAGKRVPEDAEDEDEELLSSGAEVAPFSVLSNLDRKSVSLFCSGCHRKLLGANQDDVVECYGCHRHFHSSSDCHKKHSSSPDPTDDQLEGLKPWFHSPSCKRVCNSLLLLSNKGQLTPRPHSPSSSSSSTSSSSSSSWRIVFNRRPGALGPLTWNECLKVISGDWRYSLADIKSFDITAVLKVPSPSPSPSQLKKQASSIDVSSSDMLAVSTALLDVYGDDLAELIVLSTRKEHRRQGHARNLVLNCLTPALREAGVKRLAVALDEGDEEGGAKEMWTKLGFAPIAKSELRRLSWSIPAFGRDSIQGVEYWSLEI